MKKKIIVGDNIKPSDPSWSFGNVKNFDQHINKSVPLYKWSHEIGLNVSDFFYRMEQNFMILAAPQEHLQKN